MPRTRKARRGGRKSVPWKGWGREAPKQGRERTRMLRDCGKNVSLDLTKVSRYAPRAHAVRILRDTGQPTFGPRSGETLDAVTMARRDLLTGGAYTLG